ncbi:MAG: mannonate dehydratase [Gemmatimonadetes bacterium]|nr:mannonate dehydratase [Gemmatimonadota bacterium]
MYLGTQRPVRTDDEFRVLAQLGVNHICGWPEEPHREWTADTLSRYRERVESFFITLDMIPLPLGSSLISSRTAQSECPNIMLGKSPQRDREIEHICNIIRACGQAGIPAVKYNMNLIGVPRTAHTVGRGGSRNSTFRWAEADQNAPPTIAGVVSADTFWARIDYFLERVVPVAEECRVRMACHPHDPYTPPGFMGVTRVLGTVEGLKRFVQMHESPYHGLNFCQGTVCEMLDDPAEEIYDVIRWFGERKKIFLVHFRNIRGRKLDFVEVFPDEGDVDMLKAARVYKEVGYPYMLVPDHVPWISGENPQGVAFAFTYGYIAGILQAVNAEGS